MLSTISWATFSKAALALTFLYYLAIAILFFRTEIKTWMHRSIKKISILLLIVIQFQTNLRAQTADGNNGINQANTLVRSYFDTGTQLLYAVGAISGLVGAFRVYSLLQQDHRQEAGRAAAGWFGACIFLVIVATVIKSFFGIA